MASRTSYQFTSSLNPELVVLEGSIKIGNGGAVFPGSTATVGAGIKSVTKLTTGIYRIQCQDNYYRFLGGQIDVIPPTTGAPVSDGSFSVNTPYQILNASTATNWTIAGLPSGLTPAAGQPFVASSGATGGNGTALRIIPNNIDHVDILPNPNTELGPLPTQGAYVTFQTVQNIPSVTLATSPVASTSFVTAVTVATTPTLVNPSSGSVIRFNLLLRNSSLLGKGETSSNY